jgi:hypothetical protein
VRFAPALRTSRRDYPEFATLRQVASGGLPGKRRGQLSRESVLVVASYLFST